VPSHMPISAMMTVTIVVRMMSFSSGISSGRKDAGHGEEEPRHGGSFKPDGRAHDHVAKAPAMRRR